ncbi:putative MFS efflux transporter [Usnea florida]
MAPQAGLGAFINIDTTISSPPLVLPKHSHALPDLPTAFELDESTRISRGNVPSRSATPAGAQTPRSFHELEMSRPASPESHDATEVVQTWTNPPINKWRVLSACLMNFGNGINDAAPGALIPYMEKDYNIGYAIVSLIFVTNAVGFIAAAPLSQILQSRLGRANTLVLAESVMMAAYIMLVCRPPFAVVVLSFLFLGLGMATNLAANNVFCANLANSTTTLGCLHGFYGIGATIAPLMATALVTHHHPWSTFYFISLSITTTNLLLAFLSFRTYEIDTPSLPPLHPTPSLPTPSRTALLTAALTHKTTLLGALFIFCYQGAEVSISGWVISFLISYRHSSPARVGYVTSGFWAGITLGRFLLSHPAHRLGEKRAVFALVAGAAAFQLLVWRLPNVVGDAVAVSVVGLLLGPVYPCATAVFSNAVPKRLQMGCLAGVSALGSAGGAVAPFFTGLLAQGVGTWVLHPICIGLFVGMGGCWVGVPGVGKRRE